MAKGQWNNDQCSGVMNFWFQSVLLVMCGLCVGHWMRWTAAVLQDKFQCKLTIKYISVYLYNVHSLSVLTCGLRVTNQATPLSPCCV